MGLRKMSENQLEKPTSKQLRSQLLKQLLKIDEVLANRGKVNVTQDSCDCANVVTEAPSDAILATGLVLDAIISGEPSFDILNQHCPNFTAEHVIGGLQAVGIIQKTRSSHRSLYAVNAPGGVPPFSLSSDILAQAAKLQPGMFSPSLSYHPSNNRVFGQVVGQPQKQEYGSLRSVERHSDSSLMTSTPYGSSKFHHCSSSYNPLHSLTAIGSIFGKRTFINAIIVDLKVSHLDAKKKHFRRSDFGIHSIGTVSLLHT